MLYIWPSRASFPPCPNSSTTPMSDSPHLRAQTALRAVQTRSTEVPWLDRFSRAMVYPWFRITHVLRWYGAQNIPPGGPVIIAANHQSFYDPVLVSLTAGRRITYMGLRKFFGYPVLGRLMRLFGCVPVRENPRSPTAYRQLLRALRHGAACGIFPEGGRSRNGLIGAPRPGVGALALATAAPVVPVTIHGASQVWPVHRVLPRPGRIELVFGCPLRFPSEGNTSRTSQRDEVATEIMLRIAEGFRLLGRPDLAEKSRRSILCGTSPVKSSAATALDD